MAAALPVEKQMELPPVPIFRLTLEQYHAMAMIGILTDDDPVELLDGWLVQRPRKTPKHVYYLETVRAWVAQSIPDGWFVDGQEPITIGSSEPEPDVMIVRGKREDYGDHHPSGGDVGLVVEVADATLLRDRTPKLHIYAAARIPAYWIVNVQDALIEVYADPYGEGDKADYRSRIVLDPTGTVMLALDGRSVGPLSLSEIFA